MGEVTGLESGMNLAGGKGGGGESTNAAIALARAQAAGTLTDQQAALLPEGFGQFKFGPRQGEYIFGAPQSGVGTASTNPQDIQQAQADWNRINVANPFGSSGYSVNEQGEVVLSSEYSPELQGLLANQIGMASGTGDQAYQEQAMTQARSLVEPVLQQQRADLAANLQARGIPPGSEAFNREMGNQERKEQQIYNQMAFDAISSGAALEQQDFSQAAALLGNLPTSPFQQVDVLGSFGPKQNQLAMLLQKQMQDDAQETQERGQVIGGVSNVLGSALGKGGG